MRTLLLYFTLSIWWISLVLFIYLFLYLIDYLAVDRVVKYFIIAPLAAVWWVGNKYIRSTISKR